MQVAELTNVLAHIFILIFSKGFGSSQEETDNSKCSGTEDASGTGMGEGEGVNDVSDQIEDESQLLGTSEKVNLVHSLFLLVFYDTSSLTVVNLAA